MIHLKARGRGTKYSATRGLVESALQLAYVGGWPAALWSLWPKAADVQLIRHTVAAPRGVPACRIAFASDLHIGPTTPASVLKRAASLIRGAKPDVLLLGGDYLIFDATPAKLGRLTDWIASTAVSTVIAIVGNHDLWGDEESILETLRASGVHLLINESTRLPAPFDSIAIVGLDEPMVGNVNADAAFAGSEDAAVIIVLCHEPDGLLACGDRDFDLFLCGHTHGGQVATPWGPLLVPPGELHREFVAGFHRHRGRELFVSRGVGGAEVPVRLFAPPDVLIVDVLASSAERPIDEWLEEVRKLPVTKLSVSPAELIRKTRDSR